MLYRVALRGFAESDRRSLASFLRETDHRDPGYQLVCLSADADVILADGDSAQVVVDVVEEFRVSTTLFLSELRPIEAAWHVSRPTNPAQLLRGLDELVALLDLPPEAAASQGDDAHAQPKAAARRAARQARLKAAAAAANPSRIPPDVLVLDGDGRARDRLCAVLEYFGFCAYPARSISQAMWLLETRQFAAAFLDIVLDGSDGGAGIELCQCFKSRPRLLPGRAPVLFVVSDNSQAVDHVLAALAGSAAFLVKPLSHGDVAQALEGCGIPMPADARRG